MTSQDSRRPQQQEYGQSWAIATALWDGPKTLEEIAVYFRRYPRLLGFYRSTGRMRKRHGGMPDRIAAKMVELTALGWIEREGERYALTARGREEAEKPIADMRRTRERLQKLAQPQAVSAVGLAVHLGLAALKLPAALLSGSVGLLNDATDTLLDGLSSVLVYLGLRYDRERAVNILLVLLMLGTGGFAFYEAVRRFFVPVAPEVDGFTFLATIVSAVVCFALHLYQRLIGVRSASIALITQSVDSRNHVIVAAGVTAGLIAARLDFPLLDTLVGLVVASLILQSAIELAIETVRSLGEDEVDLSRYEMQIPGWYDRFRQAQMNDWLLYLVADKGVRTRAELITQAGTALDFSADPMLRELGVDRLSRVDEMIEASLTALVEAGWLAGEAELRVTPAGQARLTRQIRAGQQGHGWRKREARD